jgi:hypothetical protein
VGTACEYECDESRLPEHRGILELDGMNLTDPVLFVQPPDETQRFQVEIQFSNGANYDPLVTKVMNDKPRQNVQRNDSVPLGEFTEHMTPWSAQRKASVAPPSMMGGQDPSAPPTQVHRPIFSSFASGSRYSRDELPA